MGNKGGLRQMKLGQAESTAKEAYDIYRGMKREPPYIAHWDDLSREQKGLIEWVVRYTRIQCAGDD